MKYRLPHSITSWSWKMIYLLGLILVLQISESFAQEGSLDGEENIPVRITFNPADQLLGGGQSPPFTQMATFLKNAFVTPSIDMVLVQDSSVCSDGIPNTNDFEPFLHAGYQYDDDRLTGIQFTRINQIGERVLFSRKQFTYDGSKLKLYLFSKWNESIGQWVPDTRERFLYDSNERFESVITEKWSGSEWVLESKNTFIYNSENRLTAFVISYWQNEQWKFSERTIAEYNANRLPTIVSYQKYENGKWITVAKETSGYDIDFHFINEFYLVEVINESTGFLENALREVYEYDLRGFYSARIQQIWNDTTGEWQNALRDQFSYSNIGIWKSWEQQVWDNSWQPGFLRGFKYINGVQADVEQIWNPTSTEWTNLKRRLVQFDDYGNLIRERNTEVWNPISDAWVNGPVTQQCHHFWSEEMTTGIPPNLTEQLDCILMNPYLTGSKINCYSTSGESEYRARLYDQVGRMIYQQSFYEGESFSIQKSIPPGLYYLFVINQDHAQYQQKIFVQD